MMTSNVDEFAASNLGKLARNVPSRACVNRSLWLYLYRLEAFTLAWGHLFVVNMV